MRNIPYENRLHKMGIKPPINADYAEKKKVSYIYFGSANTAKDCGRD